MTLGVVPTPWPHLEGLPGTQCEAVESDTHPSSQGKKSTHSSDGLPHCKLTRASYKNIQKLRKKMWRSCGCLKSHQPVFFLQASPPHHRRRELPGEVKGCCDGVSLILNGGLTVTISISFLGICILNHLIFASL